VKRDAHEQNRRSWNLVIPAHDSHKRDQAGWLRGGGNTLFPDELELLGVPPSAWPDEHGRVHMSRETGPLAGLDLVHLQCNVGQDSLSLAQLGARVTGVDISDEAIARATALATESGIPATFLRADIYDWLADTAAGPARFDVAFSTYGTIGWLSDLDAWAAGVAGVLRPGGRLVLLEFHPIAFIFDEQLRPAFPYFGDGRVQLNPEGIGDYVGQSDGLLSPSGWQTGVTNFKNPQPCHEFAWTIADWLTALLRAGLELTRIRDYPYANGCQVFNNMRTLPGRRFAMPEGAPDLPLMCGLVARKPG
jgi:SAM-dependent methyltransferase